jgi:hypothetical protein
MAVSVRLMKLHPRPFRPGGSQDGGMRSAKGSSRLRAYELGAIAELAAPVQVWPCRQCATWYLELYERDDGQLAMRDWHDETCTHLRALECDDRADDEADNEADADVALS